MTVELRVQFCLSLLKWSTECVEKGWKTILNWSRRLFLTVRGKFWKLTYLVHWLRKGSLVWFVNECLLNYLPFCIPTGQIATNEALKRDLESIILGLQEYLGSVKCQAKQANDECKALRKDKESLLQRLADLEEERNNLEVVAMDAENMRKVRLNTVLFPQFRYLGINFKKRGKWASCE